MHDDIVREIETTYRGHLAAGPRLLFIGTSQTWGSGAATEAETWVRQLETRLKADHPTVQCINGGISGSNSDQLLATWRSQWDFLKPDLVVICLGFNDGNPEVLTRNLTAMIDLDKARGARTLLIAEPDCTEYADGGPPQRQVAVRALGTKLGVPVVDMPVFLAAHRDDGYLWWDMVHLTSYGQKLFADRLYDDVRRLLP
jgi:lysophospholipase L1-like esterase